MTRGKTSEHRNAKRTSTAVKPSGKTDEDMEETKEVSQSEVVTDTVDTVASITEDETPSNKADGEVIGGADDGKDDDSESMTIKDIMELTFPKYTPEYRIRLSTMMPSMKHALKVFNRVFNYTSKSRNVLLYGGYGAGKTYMLDAWAGNQRSMPKAHGRRLEIRRYDGDAFMDINMRVGGDDNGLLLSVIKTLEMKCKASRNHIVIVIDDLELASYIIKVAPSIQLVVEGNSSGLNSLIQEAKGDIESFEVICLDDFSPKWKELAKELVRVNKTRFVDEYHDGLDGDLALEAAKVVYKLRSDVNRYPRMNDDTNPYITIGYALDVLEQLHAKLLENDSDDELTKAKVRAMTMELADESPQSFVYSYAAPVNADYDVEDTAPNSSNQDNPKKKMKYRDVSTLEERLKSRIVNQDDAIKTLVDSIKIDAVGLRQKDRPIGVFMFDGPSGVGKTELAKCLASELYEKPANFVRLDMSEYAEKESSIKLFGAPSGYQDADLGGQLTNPVMEDPYSIILLDEAEKACSRVWDTFLQVFDAGRLTDGRGHIVDFTNTIIILTSNLGNEDSKRSGATTFTINGLNDSAVDNGQDDRRKAYKAAVEKYFRMELLNRMDAVITFNPLTRDDLRKIMYQQLDEIADMLKNGKTNLELDTKLDTNTEDWLLHKSESDKYGARELKRVLKSSVLLPLADFVINTRVDTNQGDILHIVHEAGSDVVSFEEKTKENK